MLISHLMFVEGGVLFLGFCLFSDSFKSVVGGCFLIRNSFGDLIKVATKG